MHLSAKSLVHHVFFWLRNPDSTEDRATLIRCLETLRSIEVVRGLHIGIPAPTAERGVVDSSFSVSELIWFDDAISERVYQNHPVHLTFVRNCSQLWSKVVVYDALSN
jgi:hypothetical protein